MTESIEDILSAMEQGKPLSRSPELRELAAQAAEACRLRGPPTDEQIARLANDIAQFTD